VSIYIQRTNKVFFLENTVVLHHIGVRGMVFNAIFNNNFQLYRDGQFYMWRKLEYPLKTTDLLQIIVKLYYIKLY